MQPKYKCYIFTLNVKYFFLRLWAHCIVCMTTTFPIVRPGIHFAVKTQRAVKCISGHLYHWKLDPHLMKAEKNVREYYSMHCSEMRWGVQCSLHFITFENFVSSFDDKMVKLKNYFFAVSNESVIRPGFPGTVVGPLFLESCHVGSGLWCWPLICLLTKLVIPVFHLNIRNHRFNRFPRPW